MKLKYNNFLFMPLLFAWPVLLFPDKAHAVSCEAGRYPYLSWCHDCVKGCYCKGPGFYHGAVYINSCDPAKATMRFGALVKDSGWNDVYTCPVAFPESDEKAKTEEECYYFVGATKVYNRSTTCSGGEYLPINANVCVSCKTGEKSYCPGGTFRPSTSNEQGIEECPRGQIANDTKTGCIDENVRCDAGQYLPKNSSNCQSCSSLDRYNVCDGGTFMIKQSYDQGIRKCDGDMIADSGHTQCIADPSKKAPENETIRCNAGQYLPKNASSCTSCKSGRYYVCDGGVFLTKQSYEQGIRKCDGDMIADSGHTQCIADTPKKESVSNSGNITVPAGQYLPANANKPAACSGTRKYCPGGGTYTVQSYDQGIFDCPLSSYANSTKTACTISFSRSQMQFGPNGNTTPYPRQCWIQTDDQDSYKACVFGVRIKN